MPPKISVIIPCYNSGKFLGETLSCLKNQVFKDFEIILVNDASNERITLDYLKKLETGSDISNLHVIHHAMNQGLAETRNTGIRQAKGEFIQLLDADDLIHPSKFETQLKNFEDHENVDIVLSDYLFFNEDGSRYFEDETHTKIHTSDFGVESFLYEWERGLCIPIHCALFKKSVFDSNLFEVGFKAKEDWVFWVETAKKKKRFYFNGHHHAFYRLHGSNMCKSTIGMVSSAIQASRLLAGKLETETERSHFLNSFDQHFERYYLSLYRDEVIQNYRTELLQEDVFRLAYKIQQMSKDLTGLKYFALTFYYTLRFLMRQFWK